MTKKLTHEEIKEKLSEVIVAITDQGFECKGAVTLSLSYADSDENLSLTGFFANNEDGERIPLTSLEDQEEVISYLTSDLLAQAHKLSDYTHNCLPENESKKAVKGICLELIKELLKIVKEDE